MTARVVIVEDHPIVVTGLTAALRERPEVVVAGRAASLAEARTVLATTPCDVVLLDLRLPDGSGIDLLRECQDDPASPAFLVLSSFSTPEYVSAAIALGASGFLLKTSPTSEIVRAIEQICDGTLAFTPEQLRSARTAAWAPLTEREHAILAGVIRGRSNDELALDLGIARKTVEAYLSRLFARYGVMTRTELAIHVEKAGVLQLPVRAKPGS